MHAAVITKNDMIELCQATGKFLFNGLSTKTLDQVFKHNYQRDFQVNISGDDILGNPILVSFEGSTIESIVSLFTDGLIRMYLEALSISSAAIRDIQTIQSTTISSFCTNLPVPESIDTENPVTTLTTLINYVHSLSSISSSVINNTTIPN